MVGELNDQPKRLDTRTELTFDDKGDIIAELQSYPNDEYPLTISIRGPGGFGFDGKLNKGAVSSLRILLDAHQTTKSGEWNVTVRNTTQREREE